MVREFPLQSSFLKDKCIFLTGGTGFVGKCILELVIRDHFPHVNKMYCLVRGRKGQSVQDRLINEVLPNKLFNVVRDKLGPIRFKEEVESKLVAIQGDISLPGLGISEEDRSLLRRDLNMVIHCAATVDFNERLDRSLTLNTLGTMQILDLCDECDDMDGFVHVSTAYVNSNRNESTIHERVYPMVFGEPVELVGRIQKMNLNEIAEFTKEITAVYPNTYTFTKSLAENMIIERAESMRLRELTTGRAAWSLSIVRPTVVTSTAADPVPGWVDGVSAANGIAMYIGLGVMDSTPGPRGSVLDLVPVDYLANIVIRACAAFRPPGVNFTLAVADPTRKVRTLAQDLPIDAEEEVYPTIYHAASSAINPVTWDEFGNGVVSSWAKLPPLKKQVFPPAFHKYNSDVEYTAMLHLKQQFKFSTVAMLVSLSDPKKGEKLRGLRTKLNFLYHCFTHFMTRAWAFQSTAVFRVEERQSSSRSILTSKLDSNGLRTMPWGVYLDFFIYGMYYFVLNESPSIRPHLLTQGWECVLHRRPSLVCNDEPEYVSPTNPWVIANAHELRSGFIHDPHVQGCLAEINEDTARARQVLLNETIRGERMLGGLEGVAHLQSWLASGIESIHVNRSKVLKLRDMVQLNPNARVLYLPTHHSNLEFALLCHVLERYSLPSPLVAAEGDHKVKGYQAKDDTLVSKSLFSSLAASPSTLEMLARQYLVRLIQAKGSAAVFLDSAPQHVRPQDSIASQGVVNSLENGKIHDPVKEDLFASLLASLCQPDSGVSPDDVILVPVAISHETGLDMRHISSQWSGEADTQRVARIAADAGKGRIHVSFGNAMDLGRLVKQVDQLKELGMGDLSLTHPSFMARSWQMQCQMVSPVALTAMILSSFRAPKGIRFEHARTLLAKLRDETVALGYNVDWQVGEDSTAMLSYCLEAIGPSHVAIEMSEDEGDFSGPTPAQVQRIVLKGDEASALKLRALVGQVQHVFIFDALFMAAHHHCQEQAAATGMGLPTLEDIQKVYTYLGTLLAHQHAEISVLGSQNDFQSVVDRFKSTDTMHLMDTDQGTMAILNNDRLHQDYLNCTLAMIHPTIDCYWATCCALALLPSLKDLKISSFVALIQENIREACAKRVGCHPEAAAAPTIYNALTCFSQLGLVQIQSSATSEPILSVANSPEPMKLKGYLESWCPIPASRDSSHIERILHYGSMDHQTRSYLECIEQLGYSIELFRSLDSPLRTQLGGLPTSELATPQLIPSISSTPNTSPRSDSPIHFTEPTFRQSTSVGFDNNLPTTTTSNLSSSIMLGWGHYLHSFLQPTSQPFESNDKLPSPSMDFFQHILAPNASQPPSSSTPSHSRSNSKS